MKYEERMPCRYDTEKDLINRIGSTIIRYGGKPGMCIVHGKNNLVLEHPVTGMTVAADIKPNDPLLDISCPELGYMNLTSGGRETKNLACYVERLPYRQYHQGIRSDQLSFTMIDPQDGHIPGYPQNLWINSQGFYDMLIDNYPSLDEAFRWLDDGERKEATKEGILYTIPVNEVAISRDVALKKMKAGVYFVYFKTDEVGWCTEDRVVNVRSHEEGWIVSKYLQEFKWKVI